MAKFGLLLELGDLTLGSAHLAPIAFGHGAEQREAGEADARKRTPSLPLGLLARGR